MTLAMDFMISNSICDHADLRHWSTEPLDHVVVATNCSLQKHAEPLDSLCNGSLIALEDFKVMVQIIQKSWIFRSVLFKQDK